MGCLSLNIEPLNADIRLLAKCENKPLAFRSRSCNALPSIAARCLNSRLMVTVGLVCSVGLGKYETFYVTEGPFVVEEGILKVLKDR